MGIATERRMKTREDILRLVKEGLDPKINPSGSTNISMSRTFFLPSLYLRMPGLEIELTQCFDRCALNRHCALDRQHSNQTNPSAKFAILSFRWGIARYTRNLFSGNNFDSAVREQVWNWAKL
jgi:hypothetical protein